MKEQLDNAIELIKQQDINGCITGSCLLGYFPDWNQDIDVFVYDKSSFNKLLFFFHYNSLFQILDPLELHKFNDYINNDKSSIEQLGLITIKFKYNLCIDVNVIFKKHQTNLFDVISNFDLDIIATGYDIRTQKTLSLRESTGMIGTWNRWNNNFYTTDFWSTKRLLRQFERVIKYTNRGYDLSEVTSKYIEIVEKIISTNNYYKSEKGKKYFDDTIEQFQIVLKILKVYQRDLKITPEELLILQTII
jgi:hypothetical protein